jgi:hypothetical protein
MITTVGFSTENIGWTGTGTISVGKFGNLHIFLTRSWFPEKAMLIPCRGTPRVSKPLSFSFLVVRNFKSSNIWGAENIGETAYLWRFQPWLSCYLPLKKLLNDGLVPVADWTSWWLPSQSRGDFAKPWGRIDGIRPVSWDIDGISYMKPDTMGYVCIYVSLSLYMYIYI